MFLSKRKNAVSMAMVLLILTVGAGAWRYAVGAGQDEAKPAPAARDVRPGVIPKSEERKHPMIVPKERPFQVDLRIERNKDGQRTLMASPTMIGREDRPVTFATGRNVPPINIGSGQTEVRFLGTTVQVVVRTEDRTKVRLDMTVTRSGPISISQDVDMKTTSFRFLRTAELGQPITVDVPGDKGSSLLQVTAAVREAEKETNSTLVATAEKDYQMAEFWRRTGHPESARFYYELIRRRYPNTLYDERAKKRIAELKEKSLGRVGAIYIIGIKKFTDGDILEQIELYPGQILTQADLRAAEQNLSRLQGLKSNPKVTLIDREGDSEFKDIEITVEEK